MRVPTLALLAFFLLAGACSREADPEAMEPDEPEAVLEVVEALEDRPGSGEPASSGGAGGGAPVPLMLGAGFVPDPHLERGTAGGPEDAHALHPGCTGWIGEAPSHRLRAPVAFTSLRLLAHAREDISLVVKKPDESFVCNDDAPGAGSDPEIEGFFPAGDYSIWVGAAREGARPAYVLGITELGRAQVDHARIARGL